MPGNGCILHAYNKLPLAHALRFDLQSGQAQVWPYWQLPDLANMLNSLEVRSPLLDQRMIEFAFGKVPSRLKATPTEKKILLKRLCSRLLPPEFDLQRKQGFSIPMNVWLKGGPFRTLFDDVLRDPQCSFDAQTVNGLMRDQDKGRFNGERLFGLVMFELWRREYGISL